MPPGTLLALVLTITFWASAFPGIRAALRWYTPSQLGFFRFLIASAVLGLAWQCRRPPLPKKADALGFLILGGIGIAAYNLTLNTGSLTVPAGTAGLLVNTAPIWTAAFAVMTLKERPPIGVWAGLLTSFCGAGLIAFRHGGTVGVNHGAALILIASLCHATYITLQKRYVSTYGAIGVTCYAVWIGTVFLALGSGGLIQAIHAAPWTATALILYLGVIPAALAYLCWAYVLARFPASRAVGFLFFVPVGAFIISWLWLGEKPTPSVLAGGALVLAGVALVNRRPAGPQT